MLQKMETSKALGAYPLVNKHGELENNPIFIGDTPSIVMLVFQCLVGKQNQHYPCIDGKLCSRTWPLVHQSFLGILLTSKAKINTEMG